MGQNLHGQLGGDIAAKCALHRLPLPGSCADEAIITAAAGLRHSLFVTKTGRLYGVGSCWNGFWAPGLPLSRPMITAYYHIRTQFLHRIM
eukprot:EC726103.1.p2 GENE.EC726103.1~~EC726103.1.p2  ORF type:complete len:90 (+),score=6.72 EC726103.1:377-646(+)